MKKDILVSVIITTYKREPKILKRAIDSVINQTYSNLEIIIINDSCKDSFKNEIIQLIESYGNGSITYIQNDENIGAGASRNKGIALSKGDVLAFLDDDDEWLPDKLKLMVPFIDSKVGLVSCNLLVHTEKSTYLKKIPSYPDDVVLEKLLYRNYLGGFSGPILRKDIVVLCGSMDESLLSSQDSDLWRRMSKKCNFHHVDIPLVNYYVLSESITNNSQKRLKGTISLIEKYEVEYQQYYKVRRKHVNKAIINYIVMGWNKEAIYLSNYEYQNYKKLLMGYVLIFGTAISFLTKFRKILRWRIRRND